MSIHNMVTILFLFLAPISLYAQGGQEYTGKRFYLSSAKILTNSKSTLKLSLNLSNTGKEEIRFYEAMSFTNIIVNFGPSFEHDEVSGYKHEILYELSKQSIKLRPGQILSVKSIKIRKNQKQSNKPPVEEIAPEPNQHDQSNVASNNQPEPKDLPIPEKSTKPLSPAKPEPGPSEPVKQAKAKPINPTTSKESETPARDTKVIYGESLPIPEGGVHEKMEQPVEEEACFDLLVERMDVVKRKRNHVTIEFDLANYGEGSFSFDSKDKTQDNLGFKAHFASIPRLTRGALVAGGSFFEEMFDKKKFKLEPGEKITGQIKVPLEKMTKFTPVVIIEIDPFSVVYECDKVNNTTTIVLK